MLEQLKEAYSQISLEDKRNELNKEILTLLMVTDIDGDFYNYVKGSNISEGNFLTETYIEVIKLKESFFKLLKNEENKN